MKSGEVRQINVNRKNHPSGVLDRDNLDPNIPDDIKACIGEIFMLWGAAEMQLSWIKAKHYPEKSNENVYEVSLLGRKRILRAITRQERFTLPDGTRSVWTLLVFGMPLVERVRNTIAHGECLGVWKDPADCLAVAKFDRAGQIEHHSFRFDDIRRARNFLRIADATTYDMAFAMSDFWEKVRNADEFR